MPAKGTTTGNKQNWLRAIALGLNVLGQDATNDSLGFWLRSDAGRIAWREFANELPNDGTLRNYYTEVRKTATGADQPWSIGKTVQGSAGEIISSEALPYVLLIWQRALVGGRTITIRQARWCARLIQIHLLAMRTKTVFEDDSWFGFVYGISAIYAAREQLSERNQDNSGPDTGDIDAVVAFGMATLSGNVAGTGADPALDLATRLGIAQKLGSIDSESARIDIDEVHSLREWVVQAMNQQPADTPDAEHSKLLPYWASIYITLGIRGLIDADDWDASSEEERKKRALSIGKAVSVSDWGLLQKLALKPSPNDVD